MSEPFVGEIRMAGYNFAPRGWAFCDGQLLPIAQYTALFSLIGTIYGGDGRTTFALPDLRGRAPMHPGHGPGLSDHNLGEKSGSETTTLNTAQLGAHNHALKASDSAVSTNQAAGASWAVPAAGALYRQNGTLVQMASASIANASGGGQSHNNMQPFLTVNFVIALEGIYPPRN